MTIFILIYLLTILLINWLIKMINLSAKNVSSLFLNFSGYFTPTLIGSGFPAGDLLDTHTALTAFIIPVKFLLFYYSEYS